LNNFKLKKLKYLLYESNSLEEQYLNFRSIYFKDEINNILNTEVEDYHQYLLNEFKKYSNNITLINNKIKSVEMNVYLRDQVLKDLDWSSMSYSLEVRVPYLNKTLLKMSSSRSLANILDKKDLLNYSKLNNEKYFKNYKKKGFSTPENLKKKQRIFVLEKYNSFLNS